MVPSDIEFVDVRGNIQTRLSKLFESEKDGLVIAFAAMKRLLASSEFLKEESNLLEILKESKWMLLPLSENPAAPAQGALALEISKNQKLKKSFTEYRDEETFNLVIKEREILKNTVVVATKKLEEYNKLNERSNFTYKR